MNVVFCERALITVSSVHLDNSLPITMYFRTSI